MLCVAVVAVIELAELSEQVLLTPHLVQPEIVDADAEPNKAVALEDSVHWSEEHNLRQSGSQAALPVPCTQDETRHR